MLEYKLIRSKRKTTALYVLPDGSLMVRAPLRLSKKVIDLFVNTKQGWIEKQRNKVTSTSPVPDLLDFRQTDKIPFLGKVYPVEFAEKTTQPLVFDGKQLTIGKKSPDQYSKLIEAWYRHQARKILTERIAWFSRKYNFHPKKLRISSARTRWGSCSSIGTVSFTWRLVMAPPEVIDYVVVHELVHLLENNHQKAFWNKVAEIIPDYKSHRGWLRKNGKWIMDNTKILEV